MTKPEFVNSFQGIRVVTCPDESFDVCTVNEDGTIEKCYGNTNDPEYAIELALEIRQRKQANG